MFELSNQQSQMMMLAGIILMGWILIRRQIKARYRQNAQSRADHEFANTLAKVDISRAIPLVTAPPETQRWQAEMLDLQRELKAELDMKIVVVQTLIRQADEKIARLSSLNEHSQRAARE
jgi:hypothetical protein